MYDLKFQDQAKKRGKIHVVAELVEQHAVNTNVKLCLSALKLSKKGLNIFGKCDAYFELERKVKNDNYHPVYRSEVIFRNSEPRYVWCQFVMKFTIYFLRAKLGKTNFDLCCLVIV